MDNHAFEDEQLLQSAQREDFVQEREESPNNKGSRCREAVGSLNEKETTRRVREMSTWEADLVYRPQKRLRRVQEDFEQWRNSV